MNPPLPSRRLLALLGAASVLFLWGTGPALLADVLILAAAGADWILGRDGRDLVVGREAPRRISRGAGAAVEVTVRHVGERARRVRVTDDLPAGLERDGPEEADAVVEPGEDLTLAYDVRAVGRGDVKLGAVHVRVLGPLGLVWREDRIPREDPLRIQPGVLEMRRYRLLGIRHRLRLAGLRNTRQRGEGRSFESLRTYVRGDDPRAIDWKSTARHGELLVRQYEAERSQNVMLVIDAGRLMLESLGDRERLDHALSAALLLADVANVHGDRVGVMTFADRIQTFLPPRRQPISRIGNALATVEATMAESNYPLAFSYLGQQVRRRSLIVLFTDVIDPSASSALLTQVTRSARRHLVLSVALRNPELTRWADAPAASESDAYRRAAAEEMLQARATALATLRRSGTLIADAEPSGVVTDVVNRYLDAKYRGLV